MNSNTPIFPLTICHDMSIWLFPRIPRLLLPCPMSLQTLIGPGIRPCRTGILIAFSAAFLHAVNPTNFGDLIDIARLTSGLLMDMS